LRAGKKRSTNVSYVTFESWLKCSSSRVRKRWDSSKTKEVHRRLVAVFVEPEAAAAVQGPEEPPIIYEFHCSTRTCCRCVLPSTVAAAAADPPPFSWFSAASSFPRLLRLPLPPLFYSPRVRRRRRPGWRRTWIIWARRTGSRVVVGGGDGFRCQPPAREERAQRQRPRAEGLGSGPKRATTTTPCTTQSWGVARPSAR